MKWTARFVALALAVVTITLHAQNLITIQASQVAGIANVTTTRNTVVLGQIGYGSAEFLLNITGAGAATGTLQIWLQDSVDNGTTWNDLVGFSPFTFGASVIAQRIALQGAGDGPGAGLLRSIVGATPGAGADVSETVPAGVRWELLSFRLQVLASATVANRFTRITFDDGTATPFAEAAANAVACTASQTCVYAFGAGQPNVTGQVIYVAGTPVGMRLSPGFRIKSITTGIQAGDQISGVQYLVKEWRDAPTAAPVQETISAGQVRNGPWGDRIRVREKVSGVAGSPTGPTYTITAVFR